MAHNSEKTYFELLAKLLLESFLPEIYHGITLSDKPDLLMGDNHGIEVTRAFYRGMMQSARLFGYIENKPKEQVNERDVRKMEQLGNKLLERNDGYCGYGPIEAIWINDGVLREAYKSKAEKAITYDTKTIDLFIYSPLSNWLEDIIRGFMIWVKKQEKQIFNRITVFEMPFLYTYTPRDDIFFPVPVDGEKYQQCCDAANEIAHK